MHCDGLWLKLGCYGLATHEIHICVLAVIFFFRENKAYYSQNRPILDAEMLCFYVEMDRIMLKCCLFPVSIVFGSLLWCDHWLKVLRCAGTRFLLLGQTGVWILLDNIYMQWKHASGQTPNTENVCKPLSHRSVVGEQYMGNGMRQILLADLDLTNRSGMRSVCTWSFTWSTCGLHLVYSWSRLDLHLCNPIQQLLEGSWYQTCTTHDIPTTKNGALCQAGMWAIVVAKWFTIVCRMDHISITCFQWHTDILVPCIVILGLVRRAKCGTWFGLAKTPMRIAIHMFMCSPGLFCTWAQCIELKTCVALNHQPCIGEVQCLVCRER